jgi:hypothetical protein
VIAHVILRIDASTAMIGERDDQRIRIILHGCEETFDRAVERQGGVCSSVRGFMIDSRDRSSLWTSLRGLQRRRLHPAEARFDTLDVARNEPRDSLRMRQRTHVSRAGDNLKVRVWQKVE